MATTTANAPRRELAATLMAAQATGIAGIVQERVHSTSIGVDATSTFLLQLLQELEEATAEYLVPGIEALEHAQEVELGTLITASSLSVRYVTERDAMVPLLSRFRAAFATVLRFDAWTASFLGLKTVALQATTRVLEAFATFVDDADVEQELTWLLELFVPPQTNEHQWLMDLFAPQDPEVVVRKADYLLRPTCELVSVAAQTHEHVRSAIYATILPQLLTLVQRLGDEYSGDVRVADATLNELAATIGVLLDAKMPPAASNVFSLLPLPPFVDGVETDAEDDRVARFKANASKHNDDDEEEDEDEDEPASPLKFSNGDSTIYQCVATLCGWLTTRGRRTATTIVLPLLCQAIYLHDPEQYNTDLVATIVESLTTSLHDLKLTTLADVEFAHALVESLRDVALRIPKLTDALRLTLLAELTTVLPRLETALQAIDTVSSELVAIKHACATTRASLVEAFIAWLHNVAAANHSTAAASLDVDDFVSTTATKLADPRIYGDVIRVVRNAAEADDDGDVDARAAVASAVATCATLLVRALAQLERYPKTTAKRIVAAVTRVAAASGAFIAPFADDLAQPLVAAIVHDRNASKRNAQRARLDAVACVVLSSAAAKTFEIDAHAWVNEFIHALLDAAATDASAHTLSMLASIVAASPELRTNVAAACVAQQHVIQSIVHETLARWPVFEEDVDAVLLTLDVLESLLSDDAFRALLDASTLATTLETLATNAESDDMDTIATASRRVLASEFLTHATQL